MFVQQWYNHSEVRVHMWLEADRVHERPCNNVTNENANERKADALMLLLPFKIVVYPLKAILGFVGVFLAAVLLTFVSYQGMLYLASSVESCAGLFTPVLGGFSFAGCIQVAVFLLSIYSGYNDDE